MYEFKHGDELYANFKYFFDVLSVNEQDIELQYFYRAGYPNTEITKAIIKLPLSAVTFVEHMGKYIAVKIDEKILKEKLGSIFDNLLVQSDVYNILKEDAEVTVGGDVDMEPSHDFVVMNRDEFLRMNKGKGVVDLRNTKATLNSLKKMGDKLNKKFYPKNFSKGFYKFDTFATIYENVNTKKQLDINSSEFKSWFNGSKITTNDGKPLPVYHGSHAKFDKFDDNLKGSNTEWFNAKAGFFFLDDKKYVIDFLNSTSGGNIIYTAYLNIKNPINFTLKSIFSNEEQAITILKMIEYPEADLNSITPEEALNIINSDIDIAELEEFFNNLHTPEAISILKNEGYDGIISSFGIDRDNDKEVLEYIALDSNQIMIISTEEI